MATSKKTSMSAEYKRVDYNWWEKSTMTSNVVGMIDEIHSIDKAICAANEELEKVSLQIDYNSQSQNIDELEENYGTLITYVDNVQPYIEKHIDKPLKKDFNLNATETISRISLDDFSTANTVNVLIDYDNGQIKGKVPKGSLNFDDFLGISKENQGRIDAFADLFEDQYNNYKELGMIDDATSLEDYLSQLSDQGSFDHSMDHPFKSFISSVLDMTVIVPALEAIVGKDFVTGEDLSDLARGMKAVFAVIDLATLGYGASISGLFSGGGEKAAEAFAKIVAVQFASNVAASGVSAIGEANDWPVALTVLLSLGAGIAVSVVGTKLMFKNAAGEVLGECEVDAETSEVVKEIQVGSGTNTLNWERNLKNVDELDVEQFKNLKNNGIVKVNSSGSNRPLYGAPNSYYSTGNGEHVFVYDENGKLIYDLSPKRVKAFKINKNPAGKEFFQDYKLNPVGEVPEEIKEIFGW